MWDIPFLTATSSTLCVGNNPSRSCDEQLTLAVQDIQIAKAVYQMAQ